jgi:hypothetical protein
VKYLYMRRKTDGVLFRTAKKYNEPPRRMVPKRTIADDEEPTLEDFEHAFVQTSTGEMLRGDEFTWAMPSDMDKKRLAGEGVRAR